MNAPLTHQKASAFLKAVTPDSPHGNLRPLNLLLQAAAKTFGDYLQLQHDATKRAQLRLRCQQLATDILLLDADNADATNLLARLALDENAIDDAQYLLEHALAKHPDNAGCHYSYGHVMLAKRHYEKSTDSFQKAIDIDSHQLRFYTSLAYSLQKQNNFTDAANIYRRLRTTRQNDAHINSQLIACLHQITVSHYDTALENDLIDYLEDEKGNLQYLAKPVAEILTHKYLLADPNSTIVFEKIVKDALLLAALPRIHFESAAVENLLVAARHNALDVCLYSGDIPADTETFIQALALHNMHNGYIHAQSLAEQSVLDDMIASIHREYSADPKAPIGELFLLASLYMHPADVAQETGLLQNDDKTHWPDAAREMWELSTVLEDAVASVPLAPNSKHALSLSIRAQYEQAPYPQWQHLHHRTPTHYRNALQAELCNFQAPTFLNGEKLEILIAGCGTGRQAIHVAKYFTNVQVTAVDLSQNSLRHAQKMARVHDVENVRFYQGDILDLSLGKQFHIIECSGVLHHIEEDELAMQKLLAHLRPDGLLKLGLYSTRARQIITECRQMIHSLGLSTSTQDVRDFRQLIIMKARDEKAYHRITQSPDFYSYNGCIDLLFNAYERHYEPNDIAELLHAHQLKFLGFTGLPESVRERYMTRHPEDPTLCNLANWDDFEQQQPDTFAGMYQFYVTRI